jgi:hypothetical protein
MTNLKLHLQQETMRPLTGENTAFAGPAVKSQVSMCPCIPPTESPNCNPTS